jgi:RHS repeat-associated protein
MPQTASPTSSFTATYDAWNRMTEVSASGTTVVQYQLDGINRRIVRLGYTSGTLTETRHFYFSGSRDIEQRVGTATTMDQQNVWGIRYVNELVCRDDATPERLYVCQDAIFNVTALVNSSSGTVAERFVYDPYGNVSVLSASWAATTDAYNWVYLFQGGLFDVATGLYLFGIRNASPGIGAWLERDGGYWDGANLYQEFASNPIGFTDSAGTSSCPNGSEAKPPCGSATADSIQTDLVFSTTSPSTQPSTRPTTEPATTQPTVPVPKSSSEEKLPPRVKKGRFAKGCGCRANFTPSPNDFMLPCLPGSVIYFQWTGDCGGPECPTSIESCTVWAVFRCNKLNVWDRIGYRDDSCRKQILAYNRSDSCAS